ncbi:aminotransferase class V-fold PLP-dependent enzyme [Nonomuraea sp. NPDC049152]|uniref:pyridoxal phosphate-dependent decarboxylase family protein n=1 Tax=Nonomuraea sp. NPDC049152 TaxID=3154350 RepID=UPI0033F62EBC
MSDLLAEVSRLRAGDLPVRGGKVTAYVYDTGEPEVHEAAARVYFEMLEANTLDPTAFPSVVAMEKEVVGQVAALLGGGHGIFTSGGTESIMLAVKAARDASEVADPSIVLPVTAHPAFHKAAHYLGVSVVQVPVSLETFEVSADDVAAAITPSTIMVVVSAPSYPQGVIDPVAEVAAVAAARGVPCHVDAYVGGWLLPWLRLGGAWATMRALGRDGYLALGRATLEASVRLREGLGKIAGLRVLGAPGSSLIAFASDEVDVFVVADEARRRGWFVQPQLSYAGIPANLHITVTGVTLSGVDAMLSVIADSVAAARARGPVAVPEGLVELVASLDLSTLDDAEFGALAASVGVDLAGGGQPEMAVVNTILDALPAPKREEILVRFLSLIYT